MKKKVFIIGNGFDLDLGWNTSYKVFYKSKYWPLKSFNLFCPMANYLKDRPGIDCWYDLEGILKKYASDSVYEHSAANPEDEPLFNKIREALMLFLKEEAQNPVNSDSMAIKVLKAVVANGLFSSIYTFNYTDLHGVAEKAGINSRFDYESVHGCVSKQSIILGVDDNAELRDGYSFLRKVFSPYYRSHSIRFDLQECDEVVFFGHSLGEMDYPYFADFFKAQSECSERKYGKKITIFTKDNESRIRILEQLRRMNKGQTERLLNDNDFKLIMIDNPDDVITNQFFDHLRKDSLSEYNRKRIPRITVI